MNYKVFIPTAGIGSRLKGLSKKVNKALVDINGKPSISYVVEKFPKEKIFVIALGYKGDDVKSFLEITYPERKFEFVLIDPYEGEGSGLGQTMLQCKEKLQIPFIFSSNDTIVKDDIPIPDHNWAGFSEKFDTAEYRSLRIKDGHVVDICPKGAEGNVYPYIGLCGIYNYQEFWKSMESSQSSIGVGESYGLQDLIPYSVRSYQFNWFDTGNIASVKDARDNLPLALSDANVLQKEDESIWFCNNKVIKFHINKDFISNRVYRAKSLSPFTPEIISSSEHMYAYERIDGEVLSRKPSVKNFKDFLEWMGGFWIPFDLNDKELNEFYNSCKEFYQDKTYERVQSFLDLYEVHDQGSKINDIFVEDVFTLLNSIDWEHLSSGYPCRFHGDLHFENILLNKIKSKNHKKFTLLDWRQDFGGNLETGDIYYDLAKLNHGFIISHEIIANNQYTLQLDSKGNISFDFDRKNSLFYCQQALKEWSLQNNFDWSKIDILTSLIFLNVSCLHHYPYSNLLFYLGKYNLHRALNK